MEEGQFTDLKEKVFTHEDIRFTVKGDTLYAIVLRRPENSRVTVRSLARADAASLPVFHGIIRKVDIPGADPGPVWTRDEAGLHVEAPHVNSDAPVVLRIQLD